MDAEEVIKLFDSYWFEQEIFTKQPTRPVQEIRDPAEVQERPETLEISRVPSHHVRSLSDQLSSQTSFISDSPSPKSVLLPHKLQPILSGKEVTEESPKKEEEIRHSDKTVSEGTRRRKKKGSSKSLSDLEFEELKGFIDLGFVFSEEDKNSSLVSIIPGLQRLGKKDHDGDEEGSFIPRPYLSEAWGVLDRRKEANPLINWRVPVLGNEIDMKDHLRHWAHIVASTVR